MQAQSLLPELRRSLAFFYALRVGNQRYLELPLTPETRQFVREHLERLEQAIIDTETRIGRLESPD